MAGIPVGIRLVVTGLQAFRIAGDTVNAIQRATIQGFSATAPAAAQASTAVDNYAERIKALRDRLVELQKAQEAAVLSGRAAPRGTATQITQTNSLIRSLTQQQQVSDGGAPPVPPAVGDVLGGLSGAAGVVGNIVKGVGLAVGAVTALIAVVGALAGAFVSVGNVAAAFAAVRYAGNVERDFQFIRAVLQVTQADMVRLQRTAEQVAANVPTAFRAIIAQIQELGRAGIAIDDIVGKASQLTAALSVLARGEISPGKLAEALGAGAVQFATGDTIGDLERYGKTILGVANATRASIPEVISAFNKVGPIGAVLKTPVEDLGAFVGLITAAGVRGEEAGTGIRNFFLRIANPSKDGAAQLEKYGISLFDLEGKAKGPLDVITDLQNVFGDQAIALGKLTEQDRLYSLSQIFQTRSATIAALAITQGADAYKDLLAVIETTDPYAQAATAVDNFADKLLIIRNKGSILLNAFGQELLPGFKDFANNVDNLLAQAIDPEGSIRPKISAVGQAINALFSGQRGGLASDAVSAQFGEGAAVTFDVMLEQGARVRDLVTNDILPAIGDLFGAFVELGQATLFNEDGARSFGEAIVAITGTVVALIQTLQIVVQAIRDITPVATEMASSVGNAIGGILSAIGTTLQSLFKGIYDLGNPLLTMANNFRTLAKEIEAEGGIVGAAILRGSADGLQKLGEGTIALGSTTSAIGNNFEAISERIKQANEELAITVERDRQIAAIAQDLRREREHLVQLRHEEAEGTDRSEEIANTITYIGALEEQVAAESRLVNVDAAATAAQEALARAQAAQAGNIAQAANAYDDLAGREREEQRLTEAIASGTKRLETVYEDLARGASKAIREIVDRLDDLNTRTQTALDKLASGLRDRIADIRENLAIANADALESFNFETFMERQRTGVTRLVENINTGLTRSFEDVRRADADAREDRERGRQRELARYQDQASKIADAYIRGNAQINEDFERSVQQRHQDLQLAIQRGQQTEIEALGRTFEDRNLTRSRAREDRQLQEQFNRDISRATTADERKALAERMTEQRRAITDNRTFENETITIRRDQEKQLTDLRRQHEATQLATARGLAREELAIRRGLAEQERKYKEEQELKLLAFRFALEDAFISETRSLRDRVDTPQDRARQDQEIEARRGVQDQTLPLQNALRLLQFEEEARRRAVQAVRQEDKATLDARRQAIEILLQYETDFAKLNRDAVQRIADIGEQGLNQVQDVERSVGQAFGASSAAAQRIAGLVGGLQGQVSGIFGGSRPVVVPGVLQQGAPLPSATAVPAMQPAEFLALAAVPYSLLSGDIRDLTTSVIQLNNMLQTKAQEIKVGGINVNIDDINVPGTIINDGGTAGVARVFNAAAPVIANRIRPKADGS